MKIETHVKKLNEYGLKLVRLSGWKRSDFKPHVNCEPRVKVVNTWYELDLLRGILRIVQTKKDGTTYSGFYSTPVNNDKAMRNIITICKNRNWSVSYTTDASKYL